MWRPWYAALWAEAAVLTGSADAADRVQRARSATADNPIATAIVDRAAALPRRRRPRRADRRGRRAAGSRLPLPVGPDTRLLGGRDRVRGEAVLAAWAPRRWSGLQDDVERGLRPPDAPG